MILVASTLCRYAMADPDTWGAWLYGAEELRAQSPERVYFFCAIEVDALGIDPFRPLLDRLNALGGSWMVYSLDDGRTSVTTGNRLAHLTLGQNLCSQRAHDMGASHMLFMAADCQPPADALPKLLAVSGGLVGGHVPTYCFAYPEPIATYGPACPVVEHMPTAAFVLVRRDVFTALRWRTDRDLGMTDDPCYAHDAERLLGVRPLVRLDVVGKHFPEAIGAIETRYAGRDMSVKRAGA